MSRLRSGVNGSRVALQSGSHHHSFGGNESSLLVLRSGATPIVTLGEDDDIEATRQGFRAGVTFSAVKPSNRERVYKPLNVMRGRMLREKRRHHRLVFRTRVVGSWKIHELRRLTAESLEIGEGGTSVTPSGGLEAGQEVATGICPASQFSAGKGPSPEARPIAVCGIRVGFTWTAEVARHSLLPNPVRSHRPGIRIFAPGASRGDPALHQRSRHRLSSPLGGRQEQSSRGLPRKQNDKRVPEPGLAAAMGSVRILPLSRP